MSDLNLGGMIRPVPARARFSMPGYHVWCGTMCRTGGGVCHLWFSRWPRERGFEAWVTHSEVCYATAEDPLGPYVFRSVALPVREGYWDGEVTHNPQVLVHDGRYYLYYTGNHGGGDWWTHRNHQRVGVAVADDPAGPWERMDRPLIEVNPGSWDALITTNPTACRMPDGRFLVVYKTVGQGEMPFGGTVRHAAAVSDSPVGPFVRFEESILEHPTAKFAAEDPCVFVHQSTIYLIAKDMGGHFQANGTGLVLFESIDGAKWSLARHPWVSGLQVQFEGESPRAIGRLERPFVYMENQAPAVLFVAVKEGEESYNLGMPLL